MKDRIFVDTNILIYYVSDDIPKKVISRDLLICNEEIVISSQVINEFMAITRKKKILSVKKSIYYAEEFMDIFEFSVITQATIKQSFKIMEKYKFSNWDSLIIASALENTCDKVCTEDMQDGQRIEDRLMIINPFK